MSANLGTITYTSVSWTAGDVITEAKLDAMVANDQAYDSHSAQGLLLDNNKSLVAKNAAGTVNANIAKVNASDVLEIGDENLSGNNIVGALTINQNDVTNNPNAVNIVNTGDGIALRIDNDGDGYSLIIDSNKSVGIGTGATTPWTPFCIDMGDVTNVFGIRSVAGSSAAKTILTGKGNGSLIIGADGARAYLYWTNGTTVYQYVMSGTAY